MEHVVDLLLILLLILVFVTAAVSIVVPKRLPDGLGWTLLILFSLIAILFLLSLGQALGILPIPLPEVVRWPFRIILLVNAVAFEIELLRAGAFRKPEEQ